MKLPVFISWSGERSKSVAVALAEWLPHVLHSVDPWISTEIRSGKAWFSELRVRLEKSAFGIVCVTAENQSEPWLNFEAGACAKVVSEAQCCPYLLGFSDASEVKLPLGGFQARRANKKDTLALVCDINEALGDHAVKETVLARVFERFWGDLEMKLRVIPPNFTHDPKREVDDMVREILQILRGDSANRGDRRLPDSPKGTGNIARRFSTNRSPTEEAISVASLVGSKSRKKRSTRPTKDN
jgi:hypothetical protein